MKIKHLTPRKALVEVAPCIRTVAHLDVHFNHVKRFRISFPYLIFTMGLQGRPSSWTTYPSLFCRKSPISPDDNTVYEFDLPNRSWGGRLCGTYGWGTTHEEAIKRSIEKFWDVHFGYEIITNSYKRGREMLEKWANLSKENPLFWQDYDFPASGYSIELNFSDWKE